MITIIKTLRITKIIENKMVKNKQWITTMTTSNEAKYARE